MTTPFHVGNVELVRGYSLRVGTRCDVDCLLKLLIVLYRRGSTKF